MNILLRQQYVSTTKQSGSTLLVALVMMVLLTLTALSAMNASTNSIQIVGNSQFREEANAAAQQAIETVISNTLFKTSAPVATNIDINQDLAADYHVEFTPPPLCVSYIPTLASDTGVPKECLNEGFEACYWTVWQITAVVTDINGSGAKSTVRQGVRTISGLNTALAQCGV